MKSSQQGEGELRRWGVVGGFAGLTPRRRAPAGASAAAAAQVGAWHISDIFFLYSVIDTVDIFFFAPEAYLFSRAPCQALRSLAVSLAAAGLARRLEWLALAWLRKPSTSSTRQHCTRQHRRPVVHNRTKILFEDLTAQETTITWRGKDGVNYCTESQDELLNTAAIVNDCVTRFKVKTTASRTRQMRKRATGGASFHLGRPHREGDQFEEGCWCNLMSVAS